MSAASTVPCPECAGTGCPRCRWRGRRRAQLLLTVANRDTGAVASHRVTPADLDPRPAPAGGWVADLTFRVRDLAATVAAAVTPDPLVVSLPPQWRPDLPTPDRYALAAALADAARPPWRLWLGGTTAPPPPDPAARLARLRGLADLLLLDLVVEVRRHGDDLRWAVRYVTLPWPGADPVGEYVREVGRGLPAGRLVIAAARPDVPPLAELVRLVVGLDLALHVSLLDLRRHAGHPLRADGRYWAVDLRARDAPVRPDDLPTRPSLATALDECLTHLADDLAGLVPTDPDEPLPLPCSPAREPVADPGRILLRLAAEHAGRAVTVRFTRAGHTAHRHDDGEPAFVNL